MKLGARGGDEDAQGEGLELHGDKLQTRDTIEYREKQLLRVSLQPGAALAHIYIKASSH